MAREFVVALSLIAAAASAPLAAQPGPDQPQGAPPAPANAEYCLRVEPITGSRMETIRCYTREYWAQLEVDVDQEWAENGVRVINPTPNS
jgi:hypothetical protein